MFTARSYMLYLVPAIDLLGIALLYFGDWRLVTAVLFVNIAAATALSIFKKGLAQERIDLISAASTIGNGVVAGAISLFLNFDSSGAANFFGAMALPLVVAAVIRLATIRAVYFATGKR